MRTEDRTEFGTVKVLWDDLIAPRGITMKITKRKEPTAQDILDETE